MLEVPDQTVIKGIDFDLPGSAKIKSVAEWLANIVKIATIFSALVGGVFVWMYFQKVGTIFSAPDPSFALMVVIFSTMLAMVMVTFLVILLLPALVKFFAERPAQQRFPQFVLSRSVPEWKFSGFLLNYLEINPAPVFSILAFFYFSNMNEHESVAKAIPIVWVMCIVFGFGWIIVGKMSEKIKISKDIFHISYFYFVSSTLTTLWFILIFQYFVVPLYKHTLSQNSSWSEILAHIIIVGILIIHILLSWGPSSKIWMIFVGFVGVIALSVVYPGAPFLGSAALRALGFGGGLPVTLTVKRYAVGKTAAETKSVAGCLILQTGSTIILKMEDRDASRCVLPPRLLDGLNFEPRLEGIVLFQRADVTEIGAFRAELPPLPGTH